MTEDEVDMSEDEENELFIEMEALPYKELGAADSKALRGIIRIGVVKQALANVLKIVQTEDVSLLGLNLLSDPTAVELALRKQGQAKGLVLAVENIIEQAYAWQEEEDENAGQED